jgi:hypothetical protein
MFSLALPLLMLLALTVGTSVYRLLVVGAGRKLGLVLGNAHRQLERHHLLLYLLLHPLLHTEAASKTATSAAHLGLAPAVRQQQHKKHLLLLLRGRVREEKGRLAPAKSKSYEKKSHFAPGVSCPCSAQSTPA